VYGADGAGFVLNGTGLPCQLRANASWTPSLAFRCDPTAAGYFTGSRRLVWDGGARNSSGAASCRPHVDWSTSYVCPPFLSPAESRLVDAKGLPGTALDAIKAGTSASGAARLQLRDQYGVVARPNASRPSLRVQTNCSATGMLTPSALPLRVNALGAVPIGLEAKAEAFGFTNKTCQVNVSMPEQAAEGGSDPERLAGEAAAAMLLERSGPGLGGPSPGDWVGLSRAASVRAAGELARAFAAGIPLCGSSARARGPGDRGTRRRSSSAVAGRGGQACAVARRQGDGSVTVTVRAPGAPLVALSLPQEAAVLALASGVLLLRGEAPSPPAEAGQAAPRAGTTWLLAAQWVTVVMPAPLGPQGPGGLSSAELVAIVLGTVFGIALLVGVGFAARRYACCDRGGGFRLPTTWRRDLSSDRSRGLLAADGTYISGAAARGDRPGGRRAKDAAAPQTPTHGPAQPLWDAARLRDASVAAGYGVADSATMPVPLGRARDRRAGSPGLVRARLRGSSGGLTSMSRASPAAGGGSVLHSHSTTGGRLHAGAAGRRTSSSSALAAAMAAEERLRGTGLDARLLRERGIVTDTDYEDEDDESVLSIG